MPDPSSGDKPESRWQALWRKPKSRLWLGIPLGGVLMFAAGVIFWGGFNTVLEATNQEAFCISCHEMKNTVYAELKETIHYTNRTGVRATCADCHVPKQWVYKMKRKIGATFNEVPHKILGTIDTKEKFEAKRLELAQTVWNTMKGNDSRECRNCHALVSMDLEKQGKSARRKHARELESEKGGARGDKTCIECHKGIAHKMPEGYVEEEEKEDS